MRTRPSGVTGIAVLLGISAVLLLIGAIGTLAAPGPGQEGTGAATQVTLGISGWALAVVLLVGFVISSALCHGLWRMQNWGRVGTMVVAALAAIGTAIGLVQAASIRYGAGVVVAVVEVAIYLVIFFYLMRQREAFVGQRRETRLAA